MAQVTLYMDDETLDRMRAAALAAGVSMSAWLVEVVRQRLGQEWPADIVELAGVWKDLPTAEEIRGTGGRDVRREEF